MTDLMAQNAGQFGLVAGQSHQATRDIDEPARQGESVHNGTVEQGEGETERRRLRRRCQAAADAGNVTGSIRVVIDAPELGQDLGVFVQPDLLLLRGVDQD